MNIKAIGAATVRDTVIDDADNYGWNKAEQ